MLEKVLQYSWNVFYVTALLAGATYLIFLVLQNYASTYSSVGLSMNALGSILISAQIIAVLAALALGVFVFGSFTRYGVPAVKKTLKL